MRTIPDISDLFAPLESVLRHKLIPIITGRSYITDEERKLLALPCRLGGMGLINPMDVSDGLYKNSVEITHSIVSLILEKRQEIPEDAHLEMKRCKGEIKKQNRSCQMETAANLNLDDNLKRQREFATEKGASIWLTILPLEKEGFALHRSAFKDAVSLRYGWAPENLPLGCACGASFTVEHALSCPKGAYPTIRHNELRDITATMLSEVCNNVSIEPELQPIDGMTPQFATSNIEEHARSDIHARGFWGSTHHSAFFDVRVFNPNALSYKKSTPSACYSRHERSKRREYQQRIIEMDGGSFTPLVFSTSGGMGKSALTFYRRLASLMAEKHNQSYANTMKWIRCQLNFSLIRSSIMCIRGSRIHRFPNTPDSMLYTISEAKI